MKENKMDHLLNILKEAWHIYVDVSIFMLFGFLVAALLYIFFTAEKIRKYFGTGKIKPVFLSALFGIPFPL